MGVKLQVFAFINANLGAVLLVIGLLTKHWAGRENENFETYEGLWEKCTLHKHIEDAQTVCKDVAKTFGHEEGEFLPVIIFLCACLACHVASIFVSLYLICTTGKQSVAKALAGLQVFVLLFAVIGLSIYATQYDGNYYGLRWSYALGWGACLAQFAALVFTIIDIDRKRK